MKLLEESSTVVPRPTRRRVLVTLAIALVLVATATYAGYAMLTGSSDRGENAPTTLSAWVESATSECATITEQYPQLTQGPDVRLDGENLDVVETGFTELASAIGDLPVPGDADERERVDGVVAAGQEAAAAWADASSDDEIANASELTSTFVASLVEIGADCGTLD